MGKNRRKNLKNMIQCSSMREFGRFAQEYFENCSVEPTCGLGVSSINIS